MKNLRCHMFHKRLNYAIPTSRLLRVNKPDMVRWTPKTSILLNCPFQQRPT